MWSAARAWLAREEDGASVAVFRAGFGALAAFSAVRFVANGWVGSLLLAPSFHFAWVPWATVPPPAVLYALFLVQLACGLLIAWGRWVRPALIAWLGSFIFVELLDKTLYLNHYVLFTLLGATLLLAPAPARRLAEAPRVPRWLLWLLRIEITLVYVWAGVCKLNVDWLLHAEPIRTWLHAWAGLPVLGPILATPAAAYALSWGGAAYDLAVPFLLLGRRTRGLGIALVLGFHLAVGALFAIGIFPWLMILSAGLLLDPSWPRRWIGGTVPAPIDRAPLGIAPTMAWLGVIATLALFPARFLAYGDDVNWTEQGFRFSWRVLLIEKTGMVEYRLVDRTSGQVWHASPSTELTALQHRQMRTQPDMIRDYALHLAAQQAAQGRDVAVYADAWASLHGRPVQRLLRADLDLTRAQADLDRERWIVPLEQEPQLP